MKVGVTVPHNWGVEDPLQMLAMGPLAERLGFDSVWVMDHVFHTGFLAERLGDRPYYHPLAVLSHLAATTTRLSLGASVLVLPYHQPVELAKYIATLDQISGGRVILGVGAGAVAEEFAALGVPMSDRATLTDESIRLMRELWTSPRPAFQSQRWDIHDVGFSPKPIQRPLPVWVGGSSPGAMKRAATLGDGWHPSSRTPEDFVAKRDEVRAMAVAAGRDPREIAMSVRVEVGVRAGADDSRTAPLWADDAEALRTLLRDYRAAEVDHVVLALASGDIALVEAAMHTIARVLPDVR
ncbi:MAG: TIGR03619 family F420-dependent LLM class oxidoreductase [Dehalococcoidia bacterium]